MRVNLSVTWSRIGPVDSDHVDVGEVSVSNTRQKEILKNQKNSTRFATGAFSLMLFLATPSCSTLLTSQT